MSKRHKSRILAFQSLYQFDIGESNLEELLTFNWVKNKERLPLEILIFAEELISGTIQNLLNIDQVIKGHLENWSFEQISPIDKSILRFSIFSLLYQKDIPAIVTINEAIDIARKFGSDQSFRFINGILDKIQKDLKFIK